MKNTERKYTVKISGIPYAPDGIYTAWKNDLTGVMMDESECFEGSVFTVWCEGEWLYIAESDKGLEVID